jgi:hypothetical protein
VLRANRSRWSHLGRRLNSLKVKSGFKLNLGHYEPIWGHSEIFSRSFEVVLRSFWGHSEIDSRTFWGRSEVILRSFWGRSKVFLRSFWGRSEVVLSCWSINLCLDVKDFFMWTWGMRVYFGCACAYVLFVFLWNQKTMNQCYDLKNILAEKIDDNFVACYSKYVQLCKESIHNKGSRCGSVVKWWKWENKWNQEDLGLLPSPGNLFKFF